MLNGTTGSTSGHFFAFPPSTPYGKAGTGWTSATAYRVVEVRRLPSGAFRSAPGT
jgi:hypothetical protein